MKRVTKVRNNYCGESFSTCLCVNIACSQPFSLFILNNDDFCTIRWGIFRSHSLPKNVVAKEIIHNSITKTFNLCRYHLCHCIPP